MNTSRLFSIVFILLGALPARAETPLVVESVWIAPTGDALQQLASTGLGNVAEYNLNLPEEIKNDSYWGGITITDGNEIYTVIILPMKDEETFTFRGFSTALKTEDKEKEKEQEDKTFSLFKYQSDFKFRYKLRSHAIVAQAFHKQDFQMLKRDSMLYLASPGLSEEDMDSLHLNSYWTSLSSRQFHIAFLQNYPERTLLPTLPPEEEDESPFIKRVRARASKNYRDGNYIGTLESMFLGLYLAEPETKIVYEAFYAEDATPPSETEPLPFQFGGFVNPDAPVGMAFRYPLTKEDIEKVFFTIRNGTTIIPLEERVDEKKHSFWSNIVLWGIDFVPPRRVFLPRCHYSSTHLQCLIVL